MRRRDAFKFAAAAGAAGVIAARPESAAAKRKPADGYVAGAGGAQLFMRNWGEGAPHDLPLTHVEQLNRDLVSFIGD